MKSIHLLGIKDIAFIVGCGHTGTTLLATMLASHPDLYVPLRETGLFRMKWWPRSRALRQLRREALDAGRRYIVEKTPRHINVLRRIRRVIRSPRFIVMVRDGRDVTASIAHRNGGDFAVALERWETETAISLDQRGRPDAYLLRYEDLIAAPERCLREVCAFLGIAYTDRLLNYHAEPHLWLGQKEIRPASGQGAEHKAHRNWQVNQPLFDGRGRWRTQLPAEIVARFRTGRLRELMDAFGYPAEP